MNQTLRRWLIAPAVFLSVVPAVGLFAQTPGTPASAVPASPGSPLSAATLAHIAGMTALFDGRTLDGWIQDPPAPLALAGSDFTDFPAFVKKLAEKSDAVSAFLSAQFDAAGRAALAAYSPGAADVKQTTSVLMKNLRGIVLGSSFYNEARFQKIKLRPSTEALLRKNPSGLELARLNRLLLEDAYPPELSRSPAESWTVRDGAMASTGAGRGVIYTKESYSHYRLIFQLRHVSGQPDHQPCVLIFCLPPLPGELGLDALGGIQFQAPNGGHWDYRPGKNNDGREFFMNPVKPKFDNHEWSQVEILVNAKAGTARMAVAQPAGTCAVENLVFTDPTAGRAGPLAWQMHNAGLFDEFKEIRIEIDPAEDRLITVK